MSNPIFLAVDLSTYALSSSQTPVAGHELSNLKTYIGTDTWKTASTAAQTLTIDFGTAIECDAVAFQNSNLHTGNVPTELQYSSDNSTWFTATSVIGSPSPMGSPFFTTFGAHTARYWRLYITPFAQAPELGALYLGKKLDFGYPYDFPANVTNAKYQTSEEIALNGTVRASQVYGGRLSWQITFMKPGLDDATLAAFQAFFQKVRGRLRPFYFQDTGSTAYFVSLDIDIDPTKLFRANLNQFDKITMKEQLATR